MTDFLFETSNANSNVRNAVNKHCKKHGLPVKYGFSGLEANSKAYYGNVPYIKVCGNDVEIPYFGKHTDKELANLLANQSPLAKIEC